MASCSRRSQVLLSALATASVTGITVEGACVLSSNKIKRTAGKRLYEILADQFNCFENH
jgi:hypothetical protein